MEVRPLTGMTGAEIEGLDLTEPLGEDLVARLKSLLYHWQVLFFRGQHLSRDEQKRVTKLFGPLLRLPYVTPLDDDPEVIAVLKLAEERNVGVFGGDWHSDFSFLESPPAGSVLNAVEVPSYGGDTVWANQVAAYEALPEDLRRLVEGRDAIHVGKPYGVKFAPPEETRAGGSIKMVRGDPAADREVRHPAVARHPESGRKALFVNPIYTTRFDGITEEESQAPLEALYKHAIRPEFCCRFRWSPGTLAIWDNRTTLHYAVNDYDGQRRLLYRTAFAGPSA